MPHIEPFSRTFDLGVALLGSMPAARLVGKSGKMLIFFSLAYMPAGDGVCHPSNAPLQHRVAGHPHHILQLPLVGQLVEGGPGKAAVTSYRNRYLRITPAYFSDHPPD